MIDKYDQWPARSFALKDYLNDNETERLDIQNKIEEHFSRVFGYPVVVTSSGQAAIAALLTYYKANRSQIIFVPRWSSHCLWNVTGTYADPTCVSPEKASFVIVVHKYGFVEKYLPVSGQVIIEDSCDTNFYNNSTLFYNGGDFEIVSLPKVMGTYSGGLIICRDHKLAQHLRQLTKDFRDYNAFAGRQRYDGFVRPGAGFADPEVFERRNFSPDLTVLTTVYDNLAQFSVNQATIMERLAYIKRRAPRLLEETPALSDGRLPPVLPVSLSSEMPEFLLTKHINISGNLNCAKYVRHALIPLHFGVEDNIFKSIVELLS